MKHSEDARVVIVNPNRWRELASQLAAILRSGTKGPIGDPAGAPPTGFASLIDPAYWSNNVDELADALCDVARTDTQSEPLRVAAITSDSCERLTMTVEEVARALGISRAFAYEAVRRGDIPHIKIGRRTLIPRTALARVLAAQESDTE
jgi:excisionase family DNA binding protein